MTRQHEAKLRRELAAAYRLIALFGWDGHVAMHLSARLPDGTFLLNPFGVMFDEITASSLIHVDMEGSILWPEGASLNQTALLIHSDLAYHDFEGVVSGEDERERLGRDLGSKNLMLLRNHCTLAAGATIADAFYRIYTLEWCCTTQIRALAGGAELQLPSSETVERVGNIMNWFSPDRFSLNVFWPAMLRKAERDCPGFDH